MARYNLIELVRNTNRTRAEVAVESDEESAILEQSRKGRYRSSARSCSGRSHEWRTSASSCSTSGSNG